VLPGLIDRHTHLVGDVTSAEPPRIFRAEHRFIPGMTKQLVGGPLECGVVPVRLVCSALLAMTSGCGLISSRQRSSHESPARTQVVVAVESHNWNDITVYLMTGGLPQRLGMVTALGTATFKFSAQRLNTSGNVRLRALPVAGRAFNSETILVMPGQVITWRLENDLDTSSLWVY
jgi:hypothetical protein